MVSAQLLVTSVGGAFGVGGTVTEQTENGESRRFTGSGVGGGRDKGGTSGSNAGEGLTAGGFLFSINVPEAQSG